MTKTILLTYDVNDWDYQSKQFDNVKEEDVEKIIEILKKLKWPWKIDIRDYVRRDFGFNSVKEWYNKVLLWLLTQEEIRYLLQALAWVEYEDDEPIMEDEQDAYQEIFETSCGWSDCYPHTLFSVEVLTSESFLYFNK